jgi:POT family proton-dependent oligopeptide transporter
MNLTGTILLSLMSLLERASYYGVRGIIVLYAIDESGLNIDQSESLQFYGTLSFLMILLPIPFGYITDKFLGQRRSIYLGGLLTFIGYLLLMVSHISIVYASFAFLAIGTSLVKPSTTILVGRQFLKEDRNRTLAYIIFFFGINLGAFLGSITIAYVGELYGWEWGFLIAAISTVVYMSIYQFFGSTIVEQESNNLKDSNTTLGYFKMIPIFSICILLYIVFTKCSEAAITSYTIEIANSSDKTLLGFDVLDSIIHIITSLWSIPLTIVIFIYWKIKGIGRTFDLMGLSFMILIASLLVTSFSDRISLRFALDYAMIPFGMYALADALVLPLITSYVTRIADVNYSNTIYALFIFITHFLGAALVYLIINDYQTLSILIVLVLTASLLFGFRNQIRKLTYGIE